jgi:hypothetical protein
VKTKEKTKKPYPNQSKSIKKKKKKLTGARPTAGETQAVGLGGRPDLGRPWVHCAYTVGLHTQVPRLLLPSLQTHVFSSSFSSFFLFSSILSLFFLLLNENQLWEGLCFFCAIFLLYVRCQALSGCCKTHVLQMGCIVGFP